MSEKYLLFIFLCALNPTLENLGLGFQKWAIDQSPKKAAAGWKWLWRFVWIFGLLLTIVVGVIAFKVLSLGNASTMGAFAGFGLVILTLFSFLVLREKILPRELIGIAIIMVGTSILGYFSHGSQKEHMTVDMHKMIIFYACYVSFIVILLALMPKYLKSIAGVILGMIGGSMNSSGLLIQKIITPEIMGIFKTSGALGAKLGHAALFLVTTPLALLMLGLAVGGIVVLQIAYKHGKAVQIVPARAAIYIAMPTIGGMAFLGEPMPVICIVSIVLVIVGVIIATTANPSKHGH